MQKLWVHLRERRWALSSPRPIPTTDAGETLGGVKAFIMKISKFVYRQSKFAALQMKSYGKLESHQLQPIP